jgi:hypothetical protein
MDALEQQVEVCKQCRKEEAVRLDDAYGVPVYGFCSEECAIKYGYRPEVFAGAYETDDDVVERD